jgi:hypothetical protein
MVSTIGSLHITHSLVKICIKNPMIFRKKNKYLQWVVDKSPPQNLSNNIIPIQKGK